MNAKKIEDLFYKHSLSISLLDNISNISFPLVEHGFRSTNIKMFTELINKVEMELKEEIYKKVNSIADNYDALVEYLEELGTQIEELKNGK